MKTLVAILCFLFIVPSISYSQSERRPKYAPRKDKHRNKRDQLDRKQGLWKHYDYMGTLIMEVEYRDDRRNGIYRRYYGNGRLMKETEYLYGVKDGIYKRYNFDGLVTEGEYSNGKKNGHWTNYYSPDLIKNAGQYKMGYKEGEWIYYNRKGDQINKIVFKDGKDLRIILEAQKKAEDEKRLAEEKKRREPRIISRVKKK